MFLFINSCSQRYSTCSCPIIINHSRAQADFRLLTGEKVHCVSCGLAPPTVQEHKVERGEWDRAGSPGGGGRGWGWCSCVVME